MGLSNEIRLSRRLPLIVCFALASIGTLSGCTGGNDTAEEASSIAFTVNRSGFGEIWVMDANGQGRTRLTEPAKPDSDASGATSPAWSPDGKSIVFVASRDPIKEDQNDLDLFVMRADGSDRHALTDDGVYDGTPTWSPDGNKIAFAHAPGLGAEQVDGVIVAIGLDGQGRTQLTRHPNTGTVFIDTEPAWSPDGNTIAFTRATYAPDGRMFTAIYTTTPTGGTAQLLIEDAADPAWSPDGNRIAFTSTRDSFGETCFHDCAPSGEIYVARADGSGLKRLTTSEASDRSPTWAPDGRHIAFVSDRSDPHQHEYEIYVMVVEDGTLRRITANDVWDLDPAWRAGPVGP
jgi:Tol biopolymer transport system component